MGAWKPRVGGHWWFGGHSAWGRGAVMTGAAALGIAVSACVHGPSATATATPTGTATPSMTPTSVPRLGPMTLGRFPATTDGTRALMLCEQWAVLRARYVGRVLADSPSELEQWFSGDDWLAAFSDDSQLKNDPGFMHIHVGLGLVSTPLSASVSSARLLDQSCASAD